ncbi:hypothetical protein SAMN05216303_102319 [Rhodoferax sp. OV413]|uniref:hypothetical protein n=1 Tax=Rhodoferax sp. OV413 TaxID=1855285 RepID=UPI0008883C7E|nr:hypothetical protein [Rhodoferax sp. OV413]SDO77365.1 hypothetical protein SAMN05216303_102319 [Rhodoferax sp. OV413]
MTLMQTYRVTIVMEDGSMGMHEGLYADGFWAICVAMEAFPTARRISAKWLP